MKKSKLKRSIYLVILLLIMVVFFHDNFMRLWYSLKAFFYHFIYFVSYDFLIDKTPPLQAIDYILASSDGNFLNYIVPMDLNIFGDRMLLALNLLINRDVFNSYLVDVGVILYKLSRAIPFILIAFGILYLSMYLQKYVDDSLSIDSKKLIKYKTFLKVKVKPTKAFIKAQIDELFSPLVKIMTIISLLYISGLLPLLLDTLSELLLLMSGGHFLLFWNYLLLAVSDVAKFFIITPPVITIPLVIYLVEKIRVRIGIKRLNKMLDHNADFLKSVGNTLGWVGASGTGKTTALGISVLTLETVLREQLLDILERRWTKFPNFNWSKFEDYIMTYYRKEKGDPERLFNRLTIEKKIKEIKLAFLEAKSFEERSKVLFGYDYELYPLEVYDELKNENIFEALTLYAIAYFYYSITEPLSMTTTAISHSIGYDDDEKTHFPVYDPDYFNETASSKRKYSVVIDFNHLRLGAKMKNSDNEDVDSYMLDIGIWAVPEIDKERGSHKDVSSISEDDNKCNIVNDRMHTYLTIARHNTELDYEVLHKFIFDCQDIMKLNPDTRQLIETVCTIDGTSCKQQLNALPLFWLEEWILNGIYKFFKKIFLNRKEKRKDDTLAWYFIRNINQKIKLFLRRRTNKFGYDVIHFYTNNASLDDVGGKKGEGILYKVYKQIYSDRFDDVYLSTLHKISQKNSKLSVRDLMRYTKLTPTSINFKAQHSHLVEKYFEIYASGLKKQTKGGSK